VVSGGFIEFYVTATDQLLSRTVFLYLEVMRLEFVSFSKRMVLGLLIFGQKLVLYFIPVFNFNPSFNYYETTNLSFGLTVLEPSRLVTSFSLAQYLPKRLFSLQFFTQELNTIVWPNLYLYKIADYTSLSTSALQNNLVLKNVGNEGLKDASLHQFNEVSNKSRSLRSMNPIFRYDYKVGNYLTKDDAATMSFLFTTLNEITGGIRKSS
jgi:hypothetical protein